MALKLQVSFTFSLYEIGLLHEKKKVEPNLFTNISNVHVLFCSDGIFIHLASLEILLNTCVNIFASVTIST